MGFSENLSIVIIRDINLVAEMTGLLNSVQCHVRLAKYGILHFISFLTKINVDILGHYL